MWLCAKVKFKSEKIYFSSSDNERRCKRWSAWNESSNTFSLTLWQTCNDMILMWLDLMYLSVVIWLRLFCVSQWITECFFCKPYWNTGGRPTLEQRMKLIKTFPELIHQVSTKQTRFDRRDSFQQASVMTCCSTGYCVTCPQTVPLIQLWFCVSIVHNFDS